MPVLDELEFAAQVATGALAEPISGLVGLAGLGITGDPGKAAEGVSAAQEALTYQPRGGGQSAIAEGLAPLGEMIGALSEGYDTRVGQPLTERFGAPGAAAAALGKGALAVAPLPAARAGARGLQNLSRGPEMRPFSTEGYASAQQAASRGQRALETIGSELAENPEVTYYNPPTLGGRDATKLGRPRGIARAARKAAERGETVGDLTDLVRGSFEVATPEAGEQVVNILRSRGLGKVTDEGWSPRVEAGYIDRPVKIDPGRGLPSSEVQLHVPGMMEAKFGPGHALYEKIRGADDPGVLAQLGEQSRKLYGGVYDELPVGWAGVLAGLGN